MSNERRSRPSFPPKPHVKYPIGRTFPTTTLRTTALWVAGLLAAQFSASGRPGPNTAAAQSRSKAPVLVQADFSSRPDGTGSSLTLRPEAYLYDPNSGESVFGLLYVNSNQFSHWHSQKMTPDRSEYVLEANGQVAVRRQVTFLAASNTVRIIDTFQNATAQPVLLTVGVSASARYSSGTLTNLGKPAGGILGKGEIGVVIPSARNPRAQTAILYLASDNSKLKPGFNNNGGELRVNYSLTVPANGSASLVYGFARRPGIGTPTPKMIEDLFKPFKSRDWMKDVATDVRRQIVNLGRTSSPGITRGEVASPLAALLESRGWDRSDEHDLLIFNDDEQLPGTIRPSPLVVTTVHGEARIDAADVSAVIGDSTDSQVASVYLRNGEVLRGKVGSESWSLADVGGLEVKFRPGRVAGVIRRAPRTAEESDSDAAAAPDEASSSGAASPFSSPTFSSPTSVIATVTPRPTAPPTVATIPTATPTATSIAPTRNPTPSRTMTPPRNPTSSGAPGSAAPPASTAGPAVTSAPGAVPADPASTSPAASAAEESDPLPLVGWADGNRLQIAPLPAKKIALVTIWGKCQVPFGELARITQVQLPQPMQCVELHDGTRLIGLLRHEAVTWSTVRFGERTGSTAQLTDYYSPSAAVASGDDGDETAVPHCELAGECRLVGDLVDPVVKLLLHGETIDLKRNSIVRIERGDDEHPNQVVVQLAGDEELTGRLVGDHLRLKTLLGEQTISVSQLIAFNRPPVDPSEVSSVPGDAPATADSAAPSPPSVTTSYGTPSYGTPASLPPSGFGGLGGAYGKPMPPTAAPPSTYAPSTYPSASYPSAPPSTAPTYAPAPASPAPVFTPIPPTSPAPANPFGP